MSRSGPSGAAAALAPLQAPATTETAYGGQAEAWTTMATLWVHLQPGGASSEAREGQPPGRIETATATARDHPDVEAGQQLVLDGPPWRILAVHRPQPGRMTLVLDRVA